jgi:uncharacterized protein YjcR
VLVELSVMELRYQAVLVVVQDGWKVTEVAERLGVSRQSVHTWMSAMRWADSRRDIVCEHFHPRDDREGRLPGT